MIQTTNHDLLTKTENVSGNILEIEVIELDVDNEGLRMK